MASLSQYLRDTGISQVRFASEVGVSTSYLSEIVSNRKQPSLGIAARIEKATRGKVRASSLVVPAKEAS